MTGILDFNVKDAIVDSLTDVFEMMLSMTVSYNKTYFFTLKEKEHE
jgi:hypothetical protein